MDRTPNRSISVIAGLVVFTELILLQEVVFPLVKNHSDILFVVLGIVIAISISPIIWRGIEKVWKDFQDQLRMLFLFQLFSFVIFLVLSANELRQELLGLLFFVLFLNLVLGINLLARMRYLLGVVDDNKPILSGIIISLFLWSIYMGIGLFFEFLNSSLFIFQVFIIIQLLGWLYITKTLTYKVSLVDLRTNGTKDPSISIIFLFGMLFMVFGFNSTTVLSNNHLLETNSLVYMVSNLLAAFLILGLRFSRIQYMEWLPLFLGLQLFGFSVFSYFFIPVSYSISLAIISQLFLFVFGLIQFRIHGKTTLFNENFIFGIALSGMFIIPSIFLSTDLDPDNFYLIGIVVYIASMANLVRLIHKPKNNISQVDVKSSSKRAEYLSVNIDENVMPEKENMEILSIFKSMEAEGKTYLKMDDEKNAILYRGSDIELTIYLSRFHKHHDLLIEKLITTIKEYEAETDPENPNKYTQEELEDLKRKIRADITNHSYGRGPKFII